jgi:2'-5' RNA ligase
MPRIFVGCNIPYTKKIKLVRADFKKSLPDSHINWVDPDNFHITLKFLGEISSEQRDDVITVVKDISKNFSPFSFQIKGAGVFKNVKHPRVLWLGLEETKLFKNLFHSIESGLVPLGFAKESKPFNPHLTLARIKFLKDTVRLGQLIENYKGVNIDSIQVGSLIVYESLLQKKGAVYSELFKGYLK